MDHGLAARLGQPGDGHLDRARDPRDGAVQRPYGKHMVLSMLIPILLLLGAPSN
jgi:hypothetical protein